MITETSDPAFDTNASVISSQCPKLLYILNVHACR